jgi:hypothetical protein
MPAQGKQNWFMRHKIMTGVLAIVLIAMVASAASGGSDDKSNTASDDTSASTEPTPTKDAEPTKEAESTKEAEPTKKAEPTKEPEPKPAKPMVVKTATILKDFEDNELAADAKYKGKTLAITGVVNEIDTELFDDEKYILRLGSGGDFEFLTVNCNDMSTDDLAKYNKGDTVTVIGEFDDGGDLGVEVKDCEPA